MPNRRETNGDTLVELLSIIQGVDTALLNDFRQVLVTNEVEARINKQYEEDMEKEDAPVLQTDAITYASEKLEALKAKSNGASKYVRKALERYSVVVNKLASVDEQTIFLNQHIFSHLGYVAFNCVTQGIKYMANGGAHKCLDNIIPAKNPIAAGKSQLALEKQLGRDQEVEGLQTAVDILETYLQMCEECPFRAYHKNSQ